LQGLIILRKENFSMKKWIKTTCALLSVATCISAFSACDALTALIGNSSSQEGPQEQVGVVYQIADDQKTAKVVGYNSDEKEVVIEAFYQGLPVTRIDNDAFALRPITSVTMPNSVESIGYAAFYFCVNLQEVTLSSSLSAIGGSAFENCNSLIGVEIPDSVVSLGRRAFAECDLLTSVELGESLTYIGANAFGRSRNLVSVSFAVMEGWLADGKGVPSADLSNTATAARYLRSAYVHMAWTRS
jgi:hypothetical protein